MFYLRPHVQNISYKVFRVGPSPYPLLQAECTPLLLGSRSQSSDRTGSYSCLFGVFFYFWVASCSMWDLSPPPGTEPEPLTLDTWSINHWTTKEVPISYIPGLNAFCSLSFTWLLPTQVWFFQCFLNMSAIPIVSSTEHSYSSFSSNH